MRIERFKNIDALQLAREALQEQSSIQWGTALGPRPNSQGLWLVKTLVIGHWENCNIKLEVLIRRQTWSSFVFLGM